MTTARFTNMSHPQTLQAAVFLLYFEAVFAILGGGIGNYGFEILLSGVAGAFGAYMIANSKRPGYYLAIAAAFAKLVIIGLISRHGVLDGDFLVLIAYPQIIGIIFDVATLVALLHPMSRNYIKVWFD